MPTLLPPSPPWPGLWQLLSAPPSCRRRRLAFLLTFLPLLLPRLLTLLLCQPLLPRQRSSRPQQQQQQPQKQKQKQRRGPFEALHRSRWGRVTHTCGAATSELCPRMARKPNSCPQALLTRPTSTAARGQERLEPLCDVAGQPRFLCRLCGPCRRHHHCCRQQRFHQSRCSQRQMTTAMTKRGERRCWCWCWYWWGWRLVERPARRSSPASSQRSGGGAGGVAPRPPTRAQPR
mmetsp:Transcript_29325/g.58904  ORF Transcript_29325/g.58904 Transcript_29325/m.58904 type:complete len:233 (-) Transcript_29325:236-934(-)